MKLLKTLFVYCWVVLAPSILSADEGDVDSSDNQSQTIDLPEEEPTPNDARRPSDNKNEKLNAGQKMQQEIEKQRSKNFKSLKQDESDYYKNAAPKSSEAYDYFQSGHPIKPSPLKSNPVR